MKYESTKKWKAKAEHESCVSVADFGFDLARSSVEPNRLMGPNYFL